MRLGAEGRRIKKDQALTRKSTALLALKNFPGFFKTSRRIFSPNYYAIGNHRLHDL
jgi:hypothetical protein